jgi:hypothetical protein
LRLERETPSTSDCVIVYTDGSYHAEQQSGPIQTKVADGKLAQAQFDQVSQFAGPDGLGAIQQHQIPPIIVSQAMDLLLVNLPSDRGVRNLRFADADARKPFKKTLDPLLSWWKAVQHHSSWNKDVKPNSCLPNGMAPKRNDVAAAEKPLAKERLLEFGNSAARSTSARNECLFVNQDGHFHFESVVQRPGGHDSSVQSISANLDPEQLANLRTILSSPGLTAAHHIADIPYGKASYEVEILQVRIARAQQAQYLRYVTQFAISSTYSSSPVNLPTSITESGASVLSPLRHWIKETVKSYKATASSAFGSERCDTTGPKPD